MLSCALVFTHACRPACFIHSVEKMEKEFLVCPNNQTREVVLSSGNVGDVDLEQLERTIRERSRMSPS